MEEPSKFSRLRQRDVSVPMLRVKMSRRRSQSQKENRERAVNSRRQLDQVPELDSTLEASIMAVNISNVKQTAPKVDQPAKGKAIDCINACNLIHYVVRHYIALKTGHLVVTVSFLRRLSRRTTIGDA